MENEVLQFILDFKQYHGPFFWLIAILGFPEAELVALIVIAIGFLATITGGENYNKFLDNIKNKIIL